MDCIKDEATRAKSMAEGMLEQNDYFGARLFALKAQSLFPTLDGISQLVTTLEVHVSAENKIRGEVDWYSVLGVDHSADDATINKQYRKLALIVHPDKNKCIAANGAFKLISEARSVLLDPVKRSEYNERMGYGVFPSDMGGSIPSWLFQNNMGGSSAPSWLFQQTCASSAPSWLFQQNVPTYSGGPSAPSPAHDTGGPSTSMAPQNKKAKVPRNRTRAPPRETTDTFWTVCPQCNRKYEHSKIFYNSIILCQICQKPFVAFETVPPVKFVRTVKLFGRRSSVSTC